MNHTRITSHGMGQILFCMLAIDLLIRPFSQKNNISAQAYIPASILSAIIVLLLTAPFIKKLSAPVCETLQAEWQKYFFAIPVLVLFSFSCTNTLVRTQLFFNFISDTQTVTIIPLILSFGVVFYAVYCGARTLARVFGIVLWLLAASLLILFLSTFSLMHTENLVMQPFSFFDFWTAVQNGFAFPAQIPLFLWFMVMCAHNEARHQYTSTFISVVILSVVLSIATELVLGVQSQVQNQTIHAMARLGNLSVFQRLDALHSAIWLLLLLVKACAFAVGAKLAVPGLLKSCQQRWSYLVSFLILIICYPIASSFTEITRMRIESLMSVIVMIAAGVHIFIVARRQNHVTNH